MSILGIYDEYHEITGELVVKSKFSLWFWSFQALYFCKEYILEVDFYTKAEVFLKYI